jgi:hypothetical protein
VKRLAVASARRGRVDLRKKEPPPEDLTCSHNVSEFKESSSMSDFVLRAASGKWRSPFAPEIIIFLFSV